MHVALSLSSVHPAACFQNAYFPFKIVNISVEFLAPFKKKIWDPMIIIQLIFNDYIHLIIYVYL